MLISLLGLGFLIFVHELGHFLAARKLGVGVDEFSIGFGPRIISRQVGNTRYSLAAIPLGGFVRLDQICQDEKSPLARILIALAGPIVNLLFAFLAFIFVALIGIPHQTTKIGEVFPNKPAAKAGLMPGDKVVAVNGVEVGKWTEMTEMVNVNRSVPITLQVRRGQIPYEVTLAPEIANDRAMLGVRSAGEFISVKYGFGEAVSKGAELTWTNAYAAIDGFVKLFSRALPMDALGGPIMILQEGASRANAGFADLISFLAFLSVNLFVLNLLPLPVLDGGNILFNIYESVLGRPVSLRIRNAAVMVSAILLLGLTAMVCFNDLMRVVK